MISSGTRFFRPLLQFSEGAQPPHSSPPSPLRLYLFVSFSTFHRLLRNYTTMLLWTFASRAARRVADRSSEEIFQVGARWEMPCNLDALFSPRAAAHVGVSGDQCAFFCSSLKSSTKREWPCSTQAFVISEAESYGVLKNRIVFRGHQKIVLSSLDL